MKPFLSAVFAVSAFSFAAQAEDAGIDLVPFDGTYEDASFAVENAILNEGLVIDYVSHVGDMLARTKEDVGGSVDLYKAADVYLFCSAVVSRKVMEADPLNIAHCPYGVFVIETENGVSIGHRQYPDGPMQEVEALLDGIVKEAASFN